MNLKFPTHSLANSPPLTATFEMANECVRFIDSHLLDRICSTNCEVRHYFPIWPLTCIPHPTLCLSSHENAADGPTRLPPRWLYIHYILFLFSRCFQAAMKMKKKLAARKSKFQQELYKIAAQNGVTSSLKEPQV